MKVALVHNFYRAETPSGENVTVHTQLDILRKHGIQAELFALHSDSFGNGVNAKLRAARALITSYGFLDQRELKDFDPDVIHVHNTFPYIGDQWLQEFDVPKVCTLHNFRNVCANGLLFRDGRVCTDCLDQSSIHSLRHGCYAGSKAATFPIFIRQVRTAKGAKYLSQYQKLILLNESASLFFPSSSETQLPFLCLPNPVEDAPRTSETRTNDRWLVAGRLDPAKGIMELVKGWPRHHTLDVVGTGVLDDAVRSSQDQAVVFHGAWSRDELRNRLPEYTGVVMPSLWLEMQPTIVSEALAAGVPIVARAGNATSSLVHSHSLGATYSSPVELAKALDEVRSKRIEFSMNSRTYFDENLREDAWFKKIDKLYREVLDAR